MDKQRQLDDFFGLSSTENKTNGKPSFTERHGDLKKNLEKKSKNLKAKLKLLPKILSKKERYLVLVFLILTAGSIISIPILTYRHLTTPVAARGGSITEGIVGEPRHINPLLSQSDADRDLVKLIYSGLFKYNGDGKLVPDLAKSYEVSPDELNYTVYLKKGVKWHDGSNLTADDIIFTIQTAQNPDYSSFQRINWQGVDVEKANDDTIIFKLKNKYAQFLNNLTMAILPEHIWENTRPINFALSELNLKPIGSGPYQFKKLQKDSSGGIRLYELTANSNFYDSRPFIETLRFKIYESEDGMIGAYNKGEVDNISLISPQNVKKIKFRQKITIENIKMPRYFALFFNQNQSKLLSDKNVRVALAHATDKDALVQKVLDNLGTIINSPILEVLLGSDQNIKKYDYDAELAKEILSKNGWDKKDENNILVKGSDKLTIKLTTSTWPELIAIAQQLKERWKDLGIDLQIEALPAPELQQAIKERSYQMLLFGEILSLDPDPFSLWHSSQKRDPGLNLSLYDNKAADALLEQARTTLNPDERMKKYGEFEKIVMEDLPALLLYSPYYLYGHGKKINGFETSIISTPSDRFLNISRWYVETKRVWR